VRLASLAVPAELSAIFGVLVVLESAVSVVRLRLAVGAAGAMVNIWSVILSRLWSQDRAVEEREWSFHSVAHGVFSRLERKTCATAR
jgi:hypothetical protein